MRTYYFTVLLVSIFTILAQNEGKKAIVDKDKLNHNKRKKILFVIASLILIFVSGFRYYVGTDFGGYYYNGELRASQLVESIFKLNEPGIRFLYWLVRIFTVKNYVPILVFAIITIGFAMMVIYRNTDCLFMATLLFIFLGCWHFSFNAVRQCLAATIVFCGFKYLKNKEFIKYLLVVFIAFLFHRSAIIMIAPYFIVRNKLSFRGLLFLVVATLLILYSYDLLIEFTEFILQDSLANDYEYATRNVNSFRIAVAVAPALFYIALYWGRELKPVTSFYIKLIICHAVVMAMASKSAMIARVGIYTAPFCAIATPELNKIFGPKTRTIVNIGMLVLYGIYFFYEISNSSSLNTFRWVFSYI